jgi:predicted metalloprotease with PDZ domain
VYNEEPNRYQENSAVVRRRTNLDLSIGLTVDTDGYVGDVLYGGPSYRAGIAPGMKITAVDGNQFSTDRLKEAITAAKSRTASIQFIVTNGAHYQTFSLDYHGGMLYPHLQRNPNSPDLLTEILQPLAR